MTTTGGRATAVPHHQRIAQLASPARRVLSLSARRVLDGIEIGIANSGQPTVAIKYADFIAFDLHRHAVAAALRELAGLGLIEITCGKPARYRLSDGWRQVTTVAFARSIRDWARSERCPSWALRYRFIEALEAQQEQSTNRRTK